jgi:hypothetical protein
MSIKASNSYVDLIYLFLFLLTPSYIYHFRVIFSLFYFNIMMQNSGSASILPAIEEVAASVQTTFWTYLLAEIGRVAVDQVE